MTSKIKVDNINKVSDDSNIINKCGTTITLGASGDSINLAAGASQTGFGRSGSVNWDTSIKTSTFTAVSGNGYFCNTAGGAFTVNLPSSPSVGDIVAVKDYSGSFSSYNLTIGRGGSNMNGSAADSTRSTNNESLTLVYADATKGWLSVEEGTGYVGEAFITATGGTITTSGNCKIHTFTGPGTFTVCGTATCAGNNLVSYLVVAGGGGAAGIGPNNSSMGGGGAGGYRETKSPVTPYTASPLDGYPTPGNRITVSETSYPIAVGSGGAGGAGYGCIGASGAISTFSTISSAGGGYGGGNNGPAWVIGAAGGSGGGGIFSINGAAGNTPAVTPPQGNAGGNGVSPPGGCGSAGGGGAGAAGTSPPGSCHGIVGGIGAGTEIAPASGTPGPSGPLKYFAGGGAGAPFQQPPSIPGTAGGGGGNANGPSGGAGDDGTANTGGGAGGTNSTPGSSFGGASGGSGIVIIRYKYQ
jgi:hypothetical protein